MDVIYIFLIILILSKGNTVILFLTDGNPSGESISDPQKLSDLIKELNKDIKAYIFTYSIGGSANKEIPKKIACENRGVFQYIPGK